jgi:hypothetical protein
VTEAPVDEQLAVDGRLGARVGDRRHDSGRLRAQVGEQLRVLTVAGIAVGVIVVGVGSRLAMLALRLTSPDSVIGVQSDDDFTIGTFTLSGSYNLLLLGAAVGIIGVAAYQCVEPRLIGPTWFRRLTVALASGAVVGSMLVHSDGVDFRLLKPTWFAIGLFVLLPALFGGAIGPVVERVREPTSRTAVGRVRWILPIVLVLAFPLTIPIVVISAFVFTAWVLLADAAGTRPLVSGRFAVRVTQACWLAIAVLGLAALIGDVRALS